METENVRFIANDGFGLFWEGFEVLGGTFATTTQKGELSSSDRPGDKNQTRDHFPQHLVAFVIITPPSDDWR